MLSKEFLDEGLRDWWRKSVAPTAAKHLGLLSKTGLLGSQARQLSAHTGALQRERVAFIQDFAERLKLYFDNKKDYISENYSSLDTLIEFFINNQIKEQTGAQNVFSSVKEVLDDYMAAQTSRYIVTPQDKLILDRLIDDFSSQFKNTGNFSQKIAEKMGAWLYDVASTQFRDRRGDILDKQDPTGAKASRGYVGQTKSQSAYASSLESSAAPTKNEWNRIRLNYNTKYGVKLPINPEVELNRRKFQFNFTNNKWYDIRNSANPQPMSDQDQEMLNKTYQEKYIPINAPVLGGMPTELQWKKMSAGPFPKFQYNNRRFGFNFKQNKWYDMDYRLPAPDKDQKTLTQEFLKQNSSGSQPASTASTAATTGSSSTAPPTGSTP